MVVNTRMGGGKVESIKKREQGDKGEREEEGTR